MAAEVKSVGDHDPQIMGFGKFLDQIFFKETHLSASL